VFISDYYGEAIREDAPRMAHEDRCHFRAEVRPREQIRLIIAETRVRYPQGNSHNVRPGEDFFSIRIARRIGEMREYSRWMESEGEEEAHPDGEA
jgi:hypothetical protein